MGADIEILFIPDESAVDTRLDKWDLYIGVIGKFKICVSGKVFFEDECFNIVEFGVLVKRWIQNNSNNFAYKPLEYDQVLFEFLCENDGVKVMSKFGNFEIVQPIPYSTLLNAIEDYVEKLSKYLQSKDYNFEGLVSDPSLDSRG